MLFAVLFGILITPSFSARILGIVPTPSYSHQIVFHPIWKELSLRGHQVILLTTDPINNSSLTNLTEIDLHFSYDIWSDNIDFVNASQSNPLSTFDNLLNSSSQLLEAQLQHPDVLKLIGNESEHFDLVMTEFTLPTMYAFSARFNCPMIAMFSFEAPSSFHEIVGNPTHPVLYPYFMLPFTEQLTFTQRLANTFVSLFLKYYLAPKIYRPHQLLVQKHFGEHYPQLTDILKNVSVLFTNTNPIFHQIRPLGPTTIEIGGGTHFKASKPLPKDLKKTLDSASQGFIYFSLGSNVKSKQLSIEARNIILETFSELPYMVLWKFELEDMPGKPDNVVVSKWFPQQDIFRHPNIRLFITQGGLQSMEEAIYNHIPLVGMPFVGDQITNVRKIVTQGMGLSIDYKTLNKAEFKASILEVINNPKYRNRVKELAELAKDQPMTGLERAIWWTEYVLRHKGTKHLRNPAVDLPSYQYLLLDVIGFCLVVILFALFLIALLIKLLFKILRKFMLKIKVKLE